MRHSAGTVSSRSTRAQRERVEGAVAARYDAHAGPGHHAALRLHGETATRMSISCAGLSSRTWGMRRLVVVACAVVIADVLPAFTTSSCCTNPVESGLLHTHGPIC